MRTYILGPFGADSDLRRRELKLAERGGKNGKKSRNCYGTKASGFAAPIVLFGHSPDQDRMVQLVPSHSNGQRSMNNKSDNALQS